MDMDMDMDLTYNQLRNTEINIKHREAVPWGANELTYNASTDSLHILPKCLQLSYKINKVTLIK